MQYNTYLYIYSINQLQFIGPLKLCIFIGRKKEKQKIIQSTNRALFNLIIILLLSNLTYIFGEQDNESLAQSRWAADRYIYIYIYNMYSVGVHYRYYPAGLQIGMPQ